VPTYAAFYAVLCHALCLWKARGGKEEERRAVKAASENEVAAWRERKYVAVDIGNRLVKSDGECISLL